MVNLTGQGLHQRCKSKQYATSAEETKQEDQPRHPSWTAAPATEETSFLLQSHLKMNPALEERHQADFSPITMHCFLFSQNFSRIKLYRATSNHLKLQTLYGAYVFFPFRLPFFSSHLSRTALRGEITLQPVSPHRPEITGLSRWKWGF